MPKTIKNTILPYKFDITYHLNTKHPYHKTPLTVHHLLSTPPCFFFPNDLKKTKLCVYLQTERDTITL